MKHSTFTDLIFLSIIFLAACKYQNRKESSIISGNLFTKKIFFPNCLLEFKDHKFEKIDSFLYETKGKKKIISIIDGTCMKCIVNQLNKIDSAFNHIQANDDFVFIVILNVNKKDSAFFMRNLQPAIKTTGIILWDNGYNFEQKNNLLTTDLNLRTFMTNTNDEIIQYGNPIMNPDVIFEYQEKLNEK